MNDGMMLDKFGYVIVAMALTTALVVGLSEAITFDFAMFLLGAAFVSSLTISIWWNVRKKRQSQ